MITDFVRGFTAFWGGFNWVGRPGLWPFALPPLLINVVVAAAAMWAAMAQITGWLDGLLPEWLQLLRWILLPLAFLIILYLIGQLVLLTGQWLSIPFSPGLARATARQAGTRIASDDVGGWSVQLWRGFADEWERTKYLLKWGLPLLVLLFIPGVNLIVAPAWMLLGAWFLGLDFLAVAASEEGVSFQGLRERVAGRRFLVLGLGTAMGTALLIPLINLTVMPAAIVGGTRIYLSDLR